MAEVKPSDPYDIRLVLEILRFLLPIASDNRNDNFRCNERLAFVFDIIYPATEHKM